MLHGTCVGNEFSHRNFIKSFHDIDHTFLSWKYSRDTQHTYTCKCILHNQFMLLLKGLGIGAGRRRVCGP